MKLWRPFREFPPVMKAAVFMLPASLTVLLHQWFMPIPPDTREVLSHYYKTELQSWWKILDFTVFIPFQEEAVYRWPAFLLMILLQDRLIYKLQYKYWAKARIASYYLVAAVMVVMTAYWASFHDYPITVFCYGLVWGWLIFYTRNPFYSWLFHSTCNAISIGIIIAGYHLFY